MFCGVDQATNERWILDYHVLEGDTSGVTVWADLDAALGRTFPLESGAILPISAICVDSGFNTTVVAKFVSAQRSKMRRAFATKGVSGFDKPTTKEGSRLKGQNHRVLLLGVDNIKLAAQKALVLAPGEAGSIRLPDHAESEMFDQLAAERLEVTYTRGFPRYAWTKDRSQRNEAFDALVMCLAAASVVNRPLAPVNARKKPTISLKERVANLHRITNQAGVH
jgi:phage terminase large subunit GpA-like protein